MHTAQFMPALTNMRFRAGSSLRLGLCTRDRGQCESAEKQQSQRSFHFQSPELVDQCISDNPNSLRLQRDCLGVSTAT
jgi:hypothetical protein